ncbi:STAS domain-containing protein [Methylosinus sporium]|uniref:STAS domain-containing protein n=1 Tax=Methylosinus sporium TaxID=428 RepID=A0A549T0Q2_METSR|nr:MULTISPECIES: SulP family inorganic anion transporter [Methylosinus]MBU3886816.1 STAS domain-containing protein [Methylosinus sp. KRF6]TRL35388.1 STAS domain-containing protein [Methylosinus sporium]
MRDRRFRQPSFIELFTPKLVTILREGYGLADLRADAIAGLTVAIVALPLSMAFAIASGLSPDRGLYTAIIGGFLVSMLGGSRFQIGGPAGAFIVLVFAIVQRQGYDGLALATMMAGVILFAIGLLRWGTYIKYIPFPVTVGFTAGIAVIIFASQLKEIFGLSIANEPAALAPKLTALWEARGTLKPATVGVSALALAIILGLRRWRPSWPGMLIAVTVCAAATAALHLDIETIGSRFGGVPSTLPAPAVPHFDLARLRALLPDALTIAVLGAMESLLSAVVADGMSGRRHRSNCELAAQGVANVVAPLFGGIPVTGTIARTATNVRSGAKGPVSGMLHALFLLGFMLVAAPLAAYIPLASLGAVLAVVSWNMAEKKEFVALFRASRGDALVLLSTFLLTIFEDLTVGIGVGVTLGAFLFLHRLAESVEVQTGEAFLDEDRADDYGGHRPAYDSAAASDAEVMVYKISGAIFFGASATVSAALDEIGRYPHVFIFDFSEAPLIDSTAARALESFVARLRKAGTVVCVAGARPAVRRALLSAGLHEPETLYAGTVADARRRATAPQPPENRAPRLSGAALPGRA